MNAIATANLNYAAAPLGAGIATSAVSGGRAAIIAEILARILQPTAASVNSTSPASTGAAIILTQLLFSTQSVGSTNGAAPMELNLNQLLNSTALQTALAQLPPELLSKPQVIEALVLQNTLLPTADTAGAQKTLPLLQLPNNSAAATSAVASTLYRINIQWQNRILQLLSSEPLPTGSHVPLQVEANGTITLLRPEIAAKILLAQNTTANTAPAQTLSPSTPTQTIQQSLRELLPRQQALHTLVPLQQKFITPSVREQLPPPVFKALAQLLQALPKPAQVTNAENLKQTLNNSGSFFEGRLARALIADPKLAAALSKSAQAPAAENLKQALSNANSSSAESAEALPHIFASDLKAQVGALLAIIRKFAPDVPTRATTLNNEDDFIYTGKPALPQTAPHGTATGNSHNLDVLLTQLSKLLEAGFARIQLNQLDSASARHVTHESQAPVPTWVLELPLRTPHGVDQLQLRIEQRRKQQQQHTRMQWNVEIAFDLHAAGKMAATLAIIDKTVSATLWAEREHTHRRVREEIDYLRAGLESVGVKVSEMQCRLGLPAPRSRPISQQLVDIHT